MHPFRELPKPENITRFEVAGVVVSISPWPMAQIVQPTDPELDVAAAVAASRELAREHAKSTLGWWVAPEWDRLAGGLEAEGLRNTDTPGFEAIENGMALVDEPAGWSAGDVDVRSVETFDDFLAASRLLSEVFGGPEIPEHELRPRFDELMASPHTRQLIAVVDGRVIGNGFAALGPAAVNLFGGCVHPEARGRGVYRALTHARWQLAVERDTPALTVQAGRMSMPILERLGFRLVERVRVFVDEV